MTYFFIDIDGTIADASRRFAKAGEEPSRDNKKKYMEWLEAVQNKRSLLEDPVVKGMRSLIWALQSHGAEIAFITSREEKWRGITQAWLSAHEMGRIALYMRPNDNWQEAGQLKEGIIDTLTQQRPGAVLVIDDDPNGGLQTVCNSRGWTLLKAVVGGV